MSDQPTTFAPRTRVRRIPEGGPERIAYLRRIASKAGKAGRGQVKNHWSPQEWQALARIGARARWAKHREREASQAAERPDATSG